MMEEVLSPAIYVIAFGWDADKPVMTVHALAESLDEAMKCAKHFSDVYPWPAETPNVLSIRLLCKAENLVVSRKYQRNDSFRM